MPKKAEANRSTSAPEPGTTAAPEAASLKIFSAAVALTRAKD
jgi:hypothetical protein